MPKKISKASLIKLIEKQNIKVQKLYKATKKSGQAEGFLKTARQRFGAITKTKNKTRIAKGSLSKMSINQLKLLEKQQEYFIHSPYNSAKGRKEIEEKRYNTLSQTYTNLSRKAFDVMQDIFSSDELSQIREQFDLSSTQVVNLMEQTNASYERISNVLNMLADSKHISELKKQNKQSNGKLFGMIKTIANNSTLYNVLEHGNIDFADADKVLSIIQANSGLSIDDYIRLYQEGD